MILKLMLSVIIRLINIFLILQFNLSIALKIRWRLYKKIFLSKIINKNKIISIKIIFKTNNRKILLCYNIVKII
jgi:hypothetical protein